MISAPQKTWPLEELEAVPVCPVCDCATRTPLHEDLEDDTFFAAPGCWRMQLCASCGAGYLDPRPTEASVSKAYGSYYTHGKGAVRQGSGIKLILKSWLQRLSDNYAASLAVKEQDGAASVSSLGVLLVRMVPACREVIDARFRHLRLPDPGADRLLDVGCGGGDFMRRAKALGWRVEGIDFDAKAVAVARSLGLEARTGSIDAYAGQASVFDVVTCNHVIEHVYEPTRLLQDIHRLLKPGGRLWLETPNIESMGHSLFGRNWRGLEAPRHISIMNHRVLASMLERTGFLIRERTRWNVQHIRSVFASSEAIALGRDPNTAPTPVLPNWRLLKGLVTEIFVWRRREFVCFRAQKQP